MCKEKKPENLISDALIEENKNSNPSVNIRRNLPPNVYIDPEVVIEEGAVICPMTVLKGNTKICRGAVVYPFCDLTDTVVGENTEIRSTYSAGAVIGKNCTVGPFACLRKGAVIGDGCRVGDFVEIKNSVLGEGVKCAHLAYIGDSTVGAETNVGCGAVFANYNGKKKRGVTVGKKVFIGCNSNLVAPVTIGDGAYIAAGSTVTEDVPPETLCIARARQVLKNRLPNLDK
jgi:bifunctional UDP-N-acetylglucosamine pyrophosphorylase/glucosamine-1-phosphate N-acetyltransferase